MSAAYRVSHDDDVLTGEALWLSVLRRVNDRVWVSMLQLCKPRDDWVMRMLVMARSANNSVEALAGSVADPLLRTLTSSHQDSS